MAIEEEIAVLAVVAAIVDGKWLFPAWLIAPGRQSDRFKLTADIKSNASVKLTMLNVMGQVLLQQNIQPKNNKIEETINVPGQVQPGHYIIQLDNGYEKKIEKVCIF